LSPASPEATGIVSIDGTAQDGQAVSALADLHVELAARVAVKLMQAQLKPAP
jgi:hypothetical protein